MQQSPNPANLNRFLITLNEKFGERLVPVSDTVYINSSTPVKLFDTELRRVVEVLPDYIKRGMYNPDYRPPQPKRVADHPALQSSPYDYGDAVYFRQHDTVAITCPQHGEFKQKLSDHIHKKAGCPSCAGKSPVTFAQFVDRARAVHGDAYGYDQSSYTTISSTVTIKCPTHGEWSALAYNHTHNHSGCPLCSKTHQHDPSDEGILYLIRCHHFNCLKVGVSTPTRIEQRMKRHRTNYGEIEILATRHATVAEVMSMESQVLVGAERASITPGSVEGWSEMIVDTPEAVDLFDQIQPVTSDICITPYSRAMNRKWFNKETTPTPAPFLHEVVAAPHLFARTTPYPVNARSCTIELLDSKTAREFYNRSHVQGAPQSIGVTYGLRHKDIIVMVVSVGASRSNRDKSVMEIIRMASLPGYSVRGGASKLFKRLMSDLPSGTVVESYNDDRLFSGAIYQTLGMEVVRRTQPDYYWIKGDIVLRRSQSRRSKLPELLGCDFDPFKSEARNMMDAGWIRVWGSGHTLYRKVTA